MNFYIVLLLYFLSGFICLSLPYHSFHLSVFTQANYFDIILNTIRFVYSLPVITILILNKQPTYNLLARSIFLHSK